MTETANPQARVHAFVQQYGLAAPLEARLLDLASELGELAKEALKASDYGQHDFQVSDGWREEIGDVFFSLLCLADQTGVLLDQALDRVLEKYEERFTTQNDMGSGR